MDYKISKQEQRRIDEDQRRYRERQRQGLEPSSIAIATGATTQQLKEEFKNLFKNLPPEIQERVNSWERELRSNAYFILDGNGLPLIEKSLPKVRYLIAKETDDGKREFLLGILRHLELRVDLGYDKHPSQ
jgi:hypothetical protein